MMRIRFVTGADRVPAQPGCAHSRGQTAARRHAMRVGWLCFLFLAAASLWPTHVALGQTPSTLDTARFMDVSAAVGDTFFLELYIRNVDTLGGFILRARFDPALIEPLTDTIADTINVEAADRAGLRGEVFENFKAGIPDSGVFTVLAIDWDAIGGPAPLFVAGGGLVARFGWHVLPGATAQNTVLQFENDPTQPASFNTFSDSRGLRIIRPILTDGTVTITSGTVSGAPSITNCPAPVTVSQGQLVQFSVTAMDPNGNNLSLLASNLPVGATFTPSNPITGNTTVTGTFQWVPSTLQSGVFTVSFQATDSPDGNTSAVCNVPITVQTGGGIGNPPDVICQTSSVTVDQGQTVQFTVSASDLDGDSITLTASGLPTGATISPANPMQGLGPHTMTVEWTPSFTQSGAFTFSFQAVDATGRSDLCNTTVFVNEIQVDQLFSTSAAGQAPQGGVAGTPDVVIPVNLVNTQTAYGVQFDLVYDPTVFTATALQTTDRLSGFQVYENLGDTPGRIRVVTFNLNGLPIAPGSSSLLFNLVGDVNPDVAPGAYDFTFENAWEAISPDPDNPSVPLATSDGVIMVDNLGDANLDTRIDVGDVVAVIGYILGNSTFDLRHFVAADVVPTFSQLDVFDLQGIINLIFGLPLTPAPSNPGNVAPATVQLVYDPDDGAYGSYRLIADVPEDVAGVQLLLTYDPADVRLDVPQTSGASLGMDLAYRDDGRGGLIAVLIDPRNDSHIPMGRNEMLRIPLARGAGVPSENGGGTPLVRLRQVKLAAPDASRIEVAGIDPVPRDFALFQNFPNPFNPSTTIAFSLGGESGARPMDVRLDIYNVLGQRVTTLVNATLEPGRYEYTWDGTNGSGRTVSSGLYFYRLVAGGRQETKKMVLLK